MLNEKEVLNKDLSDFTLSEIVKENFRTAAIFEKYNLDFCCNGKRTLTNACSEKGINPDNIITEINEINSLTQSEIKPDEWKLDFLIDYIINNHHCYVSRMLPVISAHTQKVAMVHGENHPETKKIAEIFSAVNSEMRHHMMKEERILFPHIKILEGTSIDVPADKPYFGTIKKPIEMMEAEHQSAGNGMFDIKELTNNYTPPADACTTYKVTFQELKEFEEDLHRHVHLENNILFPKAVQLEEGMTI
ncbi:MAG: iron-sulfur cluster repair di-iron protein [Ignavibacteriales bacterium]|nr:MAG: iron-sulfur cluster repair di-iron protein [Ignavibacteriales bacterium]